MSGELDAVVLAGGRSERLNGIVPRWHKPFLVVNGKSLLVAAVDGAQLAGAGKIVVVATAENAMPVSQLLADRESVRIVLATGGPGRALAVGLEMCEAGRVLVLMSDNLFAPDDIPDIVMHQYAIGVRYVTCAEAARFTRVEHGQWVEGPTGANRACDSTDRHTAIWCGPLIIQRARGQVALTDSEKIGPKLGQLAPYADLVTTGTLDIGTPEAVQEITRRET